MSKTKKNTSISVVIPNYNDSEQALVLAEEVSLALHSRKNVPFEIVIVDDGSDLKNLELLKKHSRRMNEIKIVQLRKNFGQQVALLIGLSISKGKFVVTVDGDGQYKADAVLALFDIQSKGFCLISGIRKARKDSYFGKITSKVGGMFIRKLLKLDIKDFGSIKGFTRPLVDAILANQTSTPDVFGTALFLAPQVIETNVNHHPRSEGVSKWTFAKRMKMYFDLYLKCSDDNFGILFKFGGLLFLLSPAFTLTIFLYKFVFGHGDSVFSIASFGAIFFLTGLQLMMWSLSASMFRKMETAREVVIRNFVER